MLLEVWQVLCSGQFIANDIEFQILFTYETATTAVTPVVPPIMDTIAIHLLEESKWYFIILHI